MLTRRKLFSYICLGMIGHSIHNDDASIKKTGISVNMH